MKIQDKWTLGYIQAREHDKTQPAENKNIQLCQIKEQLENSEYTQVINDGDWQGLFYWEFSEETNDFVQLAELPAADVVPARQFAPGMYHRCQKTSIFSIRNVGSWSGAVPCVQVNNQGDVLPIQGKIRGADSSYAPKKMNFTNFLGDGSAVPDDNADRDVMKCATGTHQPSGFPMIAVQCLNSEHHEIIAFPTGNLLALDNTPNGLSTKVAKVGADGKIETDGEIASLGSLFLVIRDLESNKVVAMQASPSREDLDAGHGAIIVPDLAGNPHLSYLGITQGGPFVAAFNPHPSVRISNQGNQEYQDAQRLSFSTSVPFYRDDEKHGPIAFQETLFPVATGEDEVPEVKMAFDLVTRTWRMFVDLDSSQTLTAKVAWNIQAEGDLSEGEIIGGLTDNEGNDIGIIWIDEATSNIDFSTCGNGTVYVVVLVQKAVVRNGATRDLYRVVRVSEDSGEKINFVQAVQKSNLIYKAVRGNTPWNEGSPDITTTIGGIEKENVFRVQIPSQWDVSGGENFEYLKLNSEKVFRGLYAPFRPTPKDENFEADGVMTSLEIKNSSSIAEYKIKVDRGNRDGKHNAVTPGAEMLPRFGDKEQSLILNNIDQDAKKICKVVSYDEATGVVTGKNIFNEDQTFEATCFIAGQPGVNPPQNSVQVDGIISIHRVPTFSNAGEGQSGIADMEWISLFFLNSDSAECEFLVVDTPPLEGALVDKSRVVCSVDAEEYQILNIAVLRGFTALSTGGATVQSEDNSKPFITVPGTVLNSIKNVKADCETDTDRNIYYVTAVHCKLDGNDAYLVTGNSAMSFSATCCEEEEEEPGDGGDTGGGDSGPEEGVDLCFGSLRVELFDENSNSLAVETVNAAFDDPAVFQGGCNYFTNVGSFLPDRYQIFHIANGQYVFRIINQAFSPSTRLGADKIPISPDTGNAMRFDPRGIYLISVPPVIFRNARFVQVT